MTLVPRTTPAIVFPIGSHSVRSFVNLAAVGVLGCLLWLTVSLYLDGAFEAVLLVSSATYAALIWWAAIKFGKFDARFMLLAVSGLYAFLPVLDLAAFADQAHYNPQHLSFMLVLTLSFLGSFFFLASGEWTAVLKMHFAVPPREPIDLRKLTMALSVGLVIYLVIFQYSIGFFHHYTRGELFKLNTSAVSAMRFILQTGFLIMVAIMRPLWVDAKGRPIRFFMACRRSIGLLPAILAFSIPAIYFGIDLFELGDRRYLITFILAVGAILAPKRIPFGIFMAGAAAVLALLLFGILRDTPMKEWPSILSSRAVLSPLRPSNTEFAYWFRTADDILATTPTELLGYTPASSPPGPVKALLSTLPRFLYPGRPLGFGEWYVSKYYPDYWAEGGGYAGNLVLEATLDWGLFGPALWGALIGIAFAVTASLWGNHRLGHGLLVFAFVFLMRFDLATLMKTSGAVAVIAAIWILLCPSQARLNLDHRS